LSARSERLEIPFAGEYRSHDSHRRSNNRNQRRRALIERLARSRWEEPRHSICGCWASANTFDLEQP